MKIKWIGHLSHNAAKMLSVMLMMAFLGCQTQVVNDYGNEVKVMMVKIQQKYAFHRRMI